jgi:hypothetical protein
MYKGDLWRDHGDGREITPGIKVLRTHGHTALAEQDLSHVVQHTQGHATSMSVNTTVKLVRFSVESFEISSLSLLFAQCQQTTTVGRGGSLNKYHGHGADAVHYAAYARVGRREQYVTPRIPQYSFLEGAHVCTARGSMAGN